MIKILFIADIVGEQGLDLALDLLPRLRNDHAIDFVIANGENIKNGKGLNVQILQRMEDAGIDVVTSGNHIWDGKSDTQIFDRSNILLRPHNYPKINPGTGVITKVLKSGNSVTVVNLQGRSFLTPIDCPFESIDRILDEPDIKNNICIVDFHAESTAEKQALGWHLAGRVTAVIGTHTHVQTADERILDGGTAYITDAGMTGPSDSIIGMDKSTAIKRFRHQTPFYYKIAQGNVSLNGVLITIDGKKLKAKSIKRLNFSKAEYNGR